MPNFVWGICRKKAWARSRAIKHAVDFYQKAARNGSAEAQRAYDRLSPKVSGNSQ